YAYGLTRIGFWTYLVTSWICMLPGTAAYTFAGGALSEGAGDVRRTLVYLAIAGVLIVMMSLIPRMLKRRSQAASDLLNDTRRALKHSHWTCLGSPDAHCLLL